jgi:hypothetical protein
LDRRGIFGILAEERTNFPSVGYGVKEGLRNFALDFSHCYLLVPGERRAVASFSLLPFNFNLETLPSPPAI